MREYEQDLLLALFSKFFFYKITVVPLPWWSKDLLVENSAGGGWSSFEVHLCSDLEWTLRSNWPLKQHAFQLCRKFSTHSWTEDFSKMVRLLGRNRWPWASTTMQLKLYASRDQWYNWLSDLTGNVVLCSSALLSDKCSRGLEWSCLKVVSVPTFVLLGRPARLHRDELSC